MTVSIFNPRRPRALIIGATIGGLVTARCLQRLGFKVQVVDQSSHWDVILSRSMTGALLVPRTFRVLQYLDIVPVKSLYSHFPSFYNASGRQGLPPIKPRASPIPEYPFDGVLLTTENQLLEELKHTEHKVLLQHNSTVLGVEPIEYHFNLRLDRVKHVEYRGRLHHYNGELTDPPLEAVFFESTIPFNSLSPLQQEHELQLIPESLKCIFETDFMVIADKAPSWGRRRIVRPILVLQILLTDNLCIRGLVSVASDVPTNIHMEPRFYFKQHNWLLIHPVDPTTNHLAFTATICEKSSALVTKTMLNRYDGVLNNHLPLHDLLFNTFHQFCDPIPLYIQHILDHPTLPISYNPVHWRDCGVFSYNRIAFIGEAAKLTFPVFGTSIGTEIDDAWSLACNISPLTHLRTIKDMRLLSNKNKHNSHTISHYFQPVVSSRWYLTKVLSQYSDERQKTRGRPTEMKTKRQYMISAKYVATTKPYFFVPSVCHTLFYRYRILRYLLGKWDSPLHYPPENMGRTKKTDTVIIASQEWDDQHRSWTYQMILFIKDIIKLLDKKNV